VDDRGVEPAPAGDVAVRSVADGSLGGPPDQNNENNPMHSSEPLAE